MKPVTTEDKKNHMAMVKGLELFFQNWLGIDSTAAAAVISRLRKEMENKNDQQTNLNLVVESKNNGCGTAITNNQVFKSPVKRSSKPTTKSSTGSATQFSLNLF